MFDDTDRWLRNGGAKLVESFFGEGVRWMLDLPAALVVAAHPHYFETTPRDRLLQYLDTRITIPQLPTTAAIDAILRRRIERYAGVSDPDLPEVFGPDASAAILGVYREAGLATPRAAGVPHRVARGVEATARPSSRHATSRQQPTRAEPSMHQRVRPCSRWSSCTLCCMVEKRTRPSAEPNISKRGRAPRNAPPGAAARAHSAAAAEQRRRSGRSSGRS